MKIRNNSRILALVLALVMILPLISIPVFADENTDAPAPILSENFDGKALDDVLAGKPSSAQIVATGDTAHGDALKISVAGQGLTEYYLWENNNSKYPIENAVIADGKISGTTSKGEVVNATLPVSIDDASQKYNIGGTLNEETGEIEGGVNYSIVYGAYADSKGGAGNVATPAKFKNTAIALADHNMVTVRLDLFLPEGMKNQSGVSGRFQAAKAEGGGNQNVELFEITANGTEATINKHENATIGIGASAKVALGAWVSLTIEVDLVKNTVSMLVNGEFAFRTTALANTFAAISEIKADTLQVQIDRGSNPSQNVGDVLFDNVSVVSGASGIQYNPNALKPIHVTFDNEKLDAAPAASGGLTNLGNLSNLLDTKVVNTYGSNAWQISFERPGSENKYNIDKNPTIANPALSYETLDSIVYEIDYFFETDATGQIQVQFTGGKGCVNGAESATSVSWVDLYQIYFANGTAKLQFEGGSGLGGVYAQTATFSTGRWNRVSLVLDLDTGIRNIYVNGELVIKDVPTVRGGDLTNITVDANKLIAGAKVNKVTGAGTFQIDNIHLFEGTAPSVEPEDKTVEDFSAYKWIVGKTASGLSVPKLATYKLLEDDNVVIDIPMTTVHGDDTFALVRADGQKVYAWDVEVGYEDAEETIPNYVHIPETGTQADDEFDLKLDEEVGLYYAYYLDIDEFGNEGEYDLNDTYNGGDDYQRYYLVPASVAELATGSNSGQIARALKIAHDKFSYKDDKKIVVLTADYFIEAGSTGIIEAQFENYHYDTITTEGEGEDAVTTATTNTNGGWIQLYYFDLATGRFEGLNEFMNIGAWNNVKVFMNLETGECEIYLNNALVKTENVGKTNLTIGADAGTTFSVAKIQRTTSDFGEIAGNLYVDNVGVSTEIPEDSQYGDGYLSDEAYLNNLNKLLITVNDPSIRFETPNGIRFATKIDDEFKAQLLANLGENAIVGMGTLIAPYDYVEAAGKFTKEALAALETETEANYLDIPFIDYFDGAKGVDFGEGNFFTASIVDIKEENLMREFAAIAYVTVQVAEGDVRTYYAKSFAKMSAAYEAKATIAETEIFDWTEDELAILETYAAADVNEEIYVESPVGNSKQPIHDIEAMKEYVTTIDGRLFFGGRYDGCKLTVTGEGAFQLYYNGAFIDAVEGVAVIDALAGDPENWGLAVFGVIGSGEFTIYVESPLGSMENPIVIEDLTAPLTAQVPEAGVVYYKWIATDAGILTVTNATASGSVAVINSAISVSEVVEGEGSVKMPYGLGDEIMIEVSTIAPESDDPFVYVPAPAGEVTFSLATEAAQMIMGPAISATLAYGDCVVFTGARQVVGKVLTIENATGLVLFVNGRFNMADENGVISVILSPNDFGTVTVIVKNNDWENEAEITFNGALTSPVGAMDNPDALVVGDNTVALEEGNNQGYCYTYTPEANGTMTFAISSITEGVEGDVIVMVGYAQRSVAEDGTDGVLTVEVVAGEAISVQVVTYPDANWNYPAAEVVFTTTFEAAVVAE